MRDPVELSRKLASDAKRYDFFQILRLIENAYPDQPRIGQALRPQDEAVRFSQSADLSFHASALAQFVPAGDSSPARLIVNFFGLLGANGPMPLHLTEYALDRQCNVGDNTLTRFLDIFHHRMLSLFYRARASSEPSINLDRPDTDHFSEYVGSLFGMGQAAMRRRDVVPDFAKLHFAGLLANRNRHASGLRSILREFFKLPIAVEECIGQWLRLPPSASTRIGVLGSANRLGDSTVLGTQVWDCQCKFRIVIGPLDYAQYCMLLPGGASMPKLAAWIRNYVGDTLDWDLRIILKREEVPAFSLGGQQRLGWTTWLTGPVQRSDDAALLLNMPHRPDQSLPASLPAYR